MESRINHEPDFNEPKLGRKSNGIKITLGRWRDKADVFAAVVVIAMFLMMCGAAIMQHWHHSMYGKIEYLTPNYEFGVRIPGTNYVVNGSDTLEIRKNVIVSYNYVRLSKSEREEARERIKRIRE